MKFSENPLEENFLQSPLSVFYRLRKWIYGDLIPSTYVRWFYFINTIIGFIFFGWHLLGFFSVYVRNVVFSKKQIEVDEIIKINSQKMGYTMEELIWSLECHHITSVAIWVTVLWVLILFWKRRTNAIIYILFLFLIYFLQGIYFFGWRFITVELTQFDWYAMSLFVVLLIIDKLIPVIVENEY